MDENATRYEISASLKRTRCGVDERSCLQKKPPPCLPRRSTCAVEGARLQFYGCKRLSAGSTARRGWPCSTARIVEAEEAVTLNHLVRRAQLRRENDGDRKDNEDAGDEDIKQLMLKQDETQDLEPRFARRSTTIRPAWMRGAKAKDAFPKNT